MYGMSISHDGVCHALKSMIDDCFMEYPQGDANTAVAQEPENLNEYMVMWYGDPLGWDMGDRRYGKATIGYTRCGEVILPDTMKEPMNKCDAIFVASTSAQASFAEQLNVPVYVLSGGVDLNLFSYIERDYQVDPFVFLHAGSTDWRKGSDIACEAFKVAFDGIVNVRLVIMTPGETPMFLELREKYKSDRRYVFKVNPVSNRAEMAQKYYANAHCLVYPSIMEGWGRCLAEAMATGMPVVCFRASSMLDQFHGTCGWWVEPGKDLEGIYPLPSLNSLVDAMGLAWYKRNECSERGIAGFGRAVTELTWQAGIKKALPVLEELYAN
jgi:glycosyltransferase involved in cell wall biosynthesis